MAPTTHYRTMAFLIAVLSLTGTGNPSAAQSTATTQFALLDTAGRDGLVGAAFLGKSSPDLRVDNFDDMTEAVQVYGIWIFYENYYYNFKRDGAVKLIFEESGLRRRFDIQTDLKGKISSVRFAGPPNDYKADSLTFYARTFFQGQQEVMTGDSPRILLSEGPSSLILTGSSPWTLYASPDYQGNGSVCIFPRSGNEPNIIYNLYDIDIANDFIKSARLGCHGNSTVPYLLT